MTFDPEVIQHTKAIIHYLLSFHRLSETFFAALPHDLQLREAEWDAIEDTVLALQHTVNVTVGQLLDALNALRGEWTSRQWEGVVLGLLMAGRPDLLSIHPLVENAWVRLQAQQVLLQHPPDTRGE